MKNPWKRLTTREVYKNNWIRLREDTVITPSGSEGIYGVVEANPAIAIVPITENLETYLVGQYRYTLNSYSWEVPEGGGFPGEVTLGGAQRELKEETGLTAKKWTFLDTMYTSNCFTNEVGYIYLAEELTMGQNAPDDTEELEIKRLPFKQVWDMVLAAEIKDALAIVAIMRTYHYLKKAGRIKF